MKVAARMDSIPFSGIRKVFEEVNNFLNWDLGISFLLTGSVKVYRIAVAWSDHLTYNPKPARSGAWLAAFNGEASA